jgi:hypothetical protein
MMHSRVATARAAAIIFAAYLVSFTSALVLLLGALTTLFSCSPAMDMGDAYVFARIGPPTLVAGVLGVVHARRMFRLRPWAVPTSARALAPFSSPLRELGWTVSLLAFAFQYTSFLLSSPPWKLEPVLFHEWGLVEEVVPLVMLSRVAASLLAIRLLPWLAAVVLARQIFEPPRLIAIGMVGLAGVALLTYLDRPTSPVPILVWVLLMLNMMLAVALAAVVIESSVARAPLSTK